MEVIENGELRVEISELGAEMQSLTDLATGRNLLWTGDAAYWQGRSPVLFPAVGALWNGTYRKGGRSYDMSKHGFVRRILWELSERTADSITFAHEQTADEAAAFPWPYRVEVEYRLQGRKVCVAFRVHNAGSETMYFQIGGHPGFSLPDFEPDKAVSGYIRFEEQPDYILRVAEQGCTVVAEVFRDNSAAGIENVHYPVPADENGLVPVCADTFANEALIFPDRQISAAALLRTDGTPIVRISSSAPVWLFWMPVNSGLCQNPEANKTVLKAAPFVCFEPWYGLCDPIGFDGDVGQRPFINALAPDEVWRGGYEILVY